MSSAQPLILYRLNGACSLVPHALLHHLRLPFTTIEMTWTADRNLEAKDGSITYAEYVGKVNPTGYVPALDVGDGEIITEMIAILTYIASHPAASADTTLLGGTLLEKAQVLQWLSYLSGSLHGLAFASIFKPGRFLDQADCYEDVRAKGKKAVEAAFERIETRLNSPGRSYIVGEGLTVVDFNLYVFYRWAFLETGTDMDKYPQYTRLMREIERLAAVQKAVVAEGLQSCFEDVQ